MGFYCMIKPLFGRGHSTLIGLEYCEFLSS